MDLRGGFVHHLAFGVSRISGSTLRDLLEIVKFANSVQFLILLIYLIQLVIFDTGSVGQPRIECHANNKTPIFKPMRFMDHLNHPQILASQTLGLQGPPQTPAKHKAENQAF